MRSSESDRSTRRGQRLEKCWTPPDDDTKIAPSRELGVRIRNGGRSHDELDIAHRLGSVAKPGRDADIRERIEHSPRFEIRTRHRVPLLAEKLRDATHP